MTKSQLFIAAHAAAKNASGVAYRVAFAAGLRAAYAALKAPIRIVREFRAHAGRAWIAEITGRDPKFGFARAFLSKRDVTASRTNTYRDIQVVVEAREGAVYEWCCQESARRTERGFLVLRGGRLTAADRATVEQAMAR